MNFNDAAPQVEFPSVSLRQVTLIGGGRGALQKSPLQSWRHTCMLTELWYVHVVKLLGWTKSKRGYLRLSAEKENVFPLLQSLMKLFTSPKIKRKTKQF